MNKTKTTIDRIKIGLGIAMLAALTGCGGYVGAGYYGDGGTVVVAGPEVGFWGGGYERGRDVHVYSERGSVSRSVAHGDGRADAHGGGRTASHAGGGREKK